MQEISCVRLAAARIARVALCKVALAQAALSQAALPQVSQVAPSQVAVPGVAVRVGVAVARVDLFGDPVCVNPDSHIPSQSNHSDFFRLALHPTATSVARTSSRRK